MYKASVDVDDSPLTMEVREKMQAKENQEKPIEWFILPNESYEWDFILEKHRVENPQARGS